MYKLFTLFAGIVLFASLATVANAQAAGPKGGGVQGSGTQGQGGAVTGKDGKGGGPVGTRLLKQLNLTPDQQKQIKELAAKFQQKRQQAQQSKNRKELAGLRKQFMEDLAKILTPAQRDKLKELLAERNKKIGPLGGGTGGATGGAGGVKTGGGL